MMYSAKTDGYIVRSELQGFEAYTLQNETLRATIVPALGGKMTELRDLSDGHDFLLPPQGSAGIYAAPEFGDGFEKYDTSGFDECFPTIEPSQGFPDHGELWSRSWNCTATGEELILSIPGITAEYLFEKRIRLQGNRITLAYRVTNGGDRPFHYLWSAHPLLRVTPGMQLLLPGSVKRVLVNWSSDERLGRFGDQLSWPEIAMNGTSVDFSIVQEPLLGKAMKLFTGPLDDGYAGLFDPRKNRALMFDFDPSETPFLGLWLCYGGWPTGGSHKHFTVGLEPCNGRPDALARAIAEGECGTLDIGGAKEWSIGLSVAHGTPSEIVSGLRSGRPAALSLT